MVGTVILTALLASGCNRTPGTPVADTTNAAPMLSTNAMPVVTNTPAVPAVSVSSRTRDLGALLLTNRCETHIQLGGGKSCAITPLVLGNKQLQLTMVLESKMADGKPQGLTIMKVTTPPDQQFEVNFGGLSLTLTPQLAAE